MSEATKAGGASYAKAGVDIDAGNALIEKIKPYAKATERAGCMAGLGGFGALFDLKAAGYDDPILVSGTDGVGTKLKLAMEAKDHSTIGIDLVAMCANDLLAQGAEPLFFLDYYATGKLSVENAADVVKGIAEGCKQAGCALVGGETAEMPGMYDGEDYDLAGFCVGAVNRDQILPRMDRITSGQIVLGLASSGIHSNGFSLVRHVLNEQKVKLSDPAPFDSSKSWAEVLLTPTRLYVDACMKALELHPAKIHAIAHITGGGLPENLPRILPENVGVTIHHENWKMPPIFKWLQEAGNISNAEMWRTFNCGVGLALIVAPDDADGVMDALKSAGETVFVLGETVAHDGTQPRIELE